MLSKIIHFLLMPCSEATLYLEKQKAGQISLWQNWRLKGHLIICKWCRAYNKKIELLDSVLKNKIKASINANFKESEIQDFKNRIKENLKK